MDPITKAIHLLVQEPRVSTRLKFTTLFTEISTFERVLTNLEQCTDWIASDLLWVDVHQHRGRSNTGGESSLEWQFLGNDIHGRSKLAVLTERLYDRQMTSMQHDHNKHLLEQCRNGHTTAFGKEVVFSGQFAVPTKLGEHFGTVRVQHRNMHTKPPNTPFKTSFLTQIRRFYTADKAQGVTHQFILSVVWQGPTPRAAERSDRMFQVALHIMLDTDHTAPRDIPAIRNDIVHKLHYLLMSQHIEFSFGNDEVETGTVEDEKIR